MLIYHGTNCLFDKIDLNAGSRYKDFGLGFYATSNIETAKRMALKKFSLFGGSPNIIIYEFDDSVLQSSIINVLVFPDKASSEWIKFIDANRNRNNCTSVSDYDIVKGPIADDGVALQLERLRLHSDSADTIARDLQDKYLDQQICFKTDKSLEYLKRLSVCFLK